MSLFQDQSSRDQEHMPTERQETPHASSVDDYDVTTSFQSVWAVSNAENHAMGSIIKGAWTPTASAD